MSYDLSIRVEGEQDATSLRALLVRERPPLRGTPRTRFRNVLRGFRGSREFRHAKVSQRTEARFRRSAAPHSRLARGKAAPRLRGHQSSRGAIAWLLRAEPRDGLSGANVSRGARPCLRRGG